VTCGPHTDKVTIPGDNDVAVVLGQ
jgi:hypothetical protein